jgi:hypothetical protein
VNSKPWTDEPPSTGGVVKSLVWLSEQVLLNCGTRCGVDPTMDVKTLHRRTENEGESFLTITLPSYCKAFEKALDIGRLDPSDLSGFHFRHGLPLFLRGFLSKIFGTDRKLLENPCIDCIQSVRQICLLHKKVLLPCSEKRERKAEQAFLKCESELDGLEFSEALSGYFDKVSSIVLADILAGIPNGDPYEELRPVHGPGSTQEKILGNSKYSLQRWHTRLEAEFPFTEYGVGSLRNLGEDDCPLANVEFIEPENEEPVRVVFVPKTLKTPRVIAIEPVCMQYTQQALLKFLVPLIESSGYAGGHVNFTRQSTNQVLALRASVDGCLATIDLSEASDRVHSDLVRRLLRVCPILSDMVFACRSTRAKVPSGEIVTLNKFASMGSALCFPMEALTFFCVIVASRLHRAKLPVTGKNVREYSRTVFVYGDDIIVPSDEAPSICDDLSLFGLKVNTNKSFWTGKFRESCGMDAYDGVNITPVYCRRKSPANRRNHSELISWVEMANQFYRKGLWSVAQKIRDFINSMMKVPLPFVDKNSAGLGWASYSNARTIHRWNRQLHRFETKAMVIRPKRYADPLSGDGALLKCFRIIGSQANDLKHLYESVRRGALTLKLQWVPA